MDLTNEIPLGATLVAGVLLAFLMTFLVGIAVHRVRIGRIRSRQSARGFRGTTAR